MLILSRRVGEKVLFPSLDISVEVIDVGKERAKVGVKAPKHIRVLRDELIPWEDRQTIIVDRDSDADERSLGELAERPLQHLEEIRLAIALTLNQQGQDLHENVEHALEQALAQLNRLMEENGPVQHREEFPAAVRETARSYSVEGNNKAERFYESKYRDDPAVGQRLPESLVC